MATAKILSIELNREPPVHLFYDAEYVCKQCGQSIAVVSGDDWACVMCVLKKAGKDSVTIFGWQLSKSGVGQIFASRIQV